jgi:hypothetical protein
VLRSEELIIVDCETLQVEVIARSMSEFDNMCVFADRDGTVNIVFTEKGRDFRLVQYKSPI